MEAVSALLQEIDVQKTTGEVDSDIITLVRDYMNKLLELDGPKLTLEDAIAPIRQVEIAPEKGEKKILGTMLGKRVFEVGQCNDVKRVKTQDNKMRTRCMAWGESVGS